MHIIVSWLSASYYVGAPPARLTRIEKSLLQAYFHSVNYCQYNIVNYRTFISVSGSLSLVIANMHIERRIHE
ncbi:hypothetical protein M013TW_03530 [Staphylococcus aureus subsp. aureus M013]|nr:hypothetical protein M013TW_03530 [Staphylococcus aureus subsp. aureus M013]